MSQQPTAISHQLFLALDTATDRPSFALGSPGDGASALVALENRQDLSREIDRVVGELLGDRGVRPAELDGVIVADGPGSFTGLRIGIAFAKGLCRAGGRPLFAIPSLLGLAWRARASGLVVAEYDALRGDVYRAVYRFSAGAVSVAMKPGVIPTGTPVPADAVLAEGPVDATALIDLMRIEGAAVPITALAGWQPDYGRPAEAEARRLARDGAR